MKKIKRNVHLNFSIILGVLLILGIFIPLKNIYARYINEYFDTTITLDNLTYEEAATCLPVNQETTISFTLRNTNQTQATEFAETSEEGNATHPGVAFIINRIDQYYETLLDWNTQEITNTEFATYPNYLNAIPQTGVYFENLNINIPPGDTIPYTFNWTPTQTGYYQFDVSIPNTEFIWASGYLRVCPEGDVQGEEDENPWDKSSLLFDPSVGCQGDCEEVKTQVCNGGETDMQGTSSWDLYYIESGNPKNGQVIETGTINALTSGQCQTLTYDPANNPNGKEGNYMFKAYQRPGHPGTGELWSETCSISECVVTDIVSPTSDEGEVLGATDTMVLGYGNAVTLPDTNGINALPGIGLLSSGIIGKAILTIKKKKKIFKTVAVKSL